MIYSTQRPTVRPFQPIRAASSLIGAGAELPYPTGRRCLLDNNDPHSSFPYSAARHQSEPHSAPNQERHGPARILIVEDEMIVALDLQHTLERMGYCVVGTASSGEEAIYLAAAEQPDLLLMDIHLDDHMDGIAATGHIRQLQDTAVIYLTAQADEMTLQRARSTGPKSLLIKPFTEGALQTAVEAALCKTDD